MKYRITLVEDDTLICELITDFLNASKQFEVRHSFACGEHFYKSFAVLSEETDLIILDFQLSSMSAEQLLELIQLENKNIPILVLTSHYKQSMIGYMIKLGVACYLSKGIRLADFLLILEEVIQKGHYISRDQFPYLKESVNDCTGALALKTYNITKREVDIIYLLAKQFTAKEIGNRLFIAPKTVENYKNTLFIKTGTRSIVGLVLWAIQNRVIPLDLHQDN